MKRAKKIAALAAALCLVCTSCATSAGTNAKSYFTNTGAIVNTLFSSSKPAASSSDPVDASSSATPHRFGLKASSAGSISRLIKESVEKGIIKPLDPYTAPRYMKYIPYWA